MVQTVLCPSCGTPRPAVLEICPACADSRNGERTVIHPLPDSPQPDRIAGRYRVVGELGRGGFGRVVRAIDERLGRMVAIKLLDELLDSEESERARFSRESVILATLDHPCIVPVYDAGVDEGRPYFAMKLIDGQSLSHRIRSSTVGTTRAIEIAGQLAGALEHAHSRHVLHRDIKPSNVLEDSEGRVYLADFGISSAAFAARVTPRGTAVGTLHYMAPEVLSGEFSELSDIYSLGTVLYEMLFGVRCFPVEDQRALVGAILNSTPRFLSEPSGDIPQQAIEMLRSMLAKNPNDRKLTASDVKRVCQTILRIDAVESASTASYEVASAVTAALSDKIDALEKRVSDIVAMCERTTVDADHLLESLSLFVGEGTALVDAIGSSSRPADDDGGLLAISLSLLHMAREVERRVSEATFGEERSRGYVLRLQKSIISPASALISDLQERAEATEPTSEEFFDFEQAQAATLVPSGREWIDSLFSEDELSRYEAVMNVAGSGMDSYLAEVRERSGDARDKLLNAVWRSADVVLLEARGRSRTLFDAAIALATSDEVASRWRTLYALFRKAGASYWDPEVVRPMLDSFTEADRAVCARALLSHPHEPYRRLALAMLKPTDLWEVISSPSTPAAWLLQLWRHVQPDVGRDYLKVFFVCVRDTLARPGPAERIVSVVELVKEFYEVHAFHEDAFFRMLIELDDRVRAEARRHRLLVDFDAEYVERFKKFLADGPRMERPMEEWRSVPLAIQRKLARNGHFLKHFVCHPVDAIAMECLSHIKRLEDARTYLELYGINARLIGEVSKEKKLFLNEESRFALVANPKTPAYVVLKYIGFLRRDNLKKLSESRECNQLSRNYAQKLLARRV